MTATLPRTPRRALPGRELPPRRAEAPRPFPWPWLAGAVLAACCLILCHGCHAGDHDDEPGFVAPRQDQGAGEEGPWGSRGTP